MKIRRFAITDRLTIFIEENNLSKKGIIKFYIDGSLELSLKEETLDKIVSIVKGNPKITKLLYKNI